MTSDPKHLRLSFPMSRDEKPKLQPVNSREIEIIGVMSPGGHGRVGIGPSAGSLNWSLQFRFSAWRLPGGPLQETELSMSRDMTEAEVVSTFVAEPYQVVRVKARFVESDDGGPPEAVFLETLGLETKDTELNAFANALQKPVVLADPQFGPLTLDRSLDWYQGASQWGANAVRLNLSFESQDQVEELLTTARKLWADQAEWTGKITDCALKHLLELKNDCWLGEDETEVSPQEFATRMLLESIVVEPGGAFEFWYDDGDLFWGHSINVRGNLTEGPKYAGIAG